MSTLKIIAGLGCLAVALLLAPFAWVSFLLGILWFKFIPAAFTVGLVATGLFLILKRRVPLSKQAKMLITIFVSILVVGPIIMDFHIRGERRALQIRAKEFLSRPVPDMFKTNVIGVFEARPDDTTVLSTSHRLIERYAKNGRIRRSGVIKVQFYNSGSETRVCKDAAENNKEARVYIGDCMAIINDEWRMGFWQWVEDTIEFKSVIPEIEEDKDRVGRFIERLDGTWTNNSGTMTISPNGRFSAIWSSQTHTNVLNGNQVLRIHDAVLMVFPNSPAGTPNAEKKEFRIFYVDHHNLIYELDGQTNWMSR